MISCFSFWPLVSPTDFRQLTRPLWIRLWIRWLRSPTTSAPSWRIHPPPTFWSGRSGRRCEADRKTRSPETPRRAPPIPHPRRLVEKALSPETARDHRLGGLDKDAWGNLRLLHVSLTTMVPQKITGLGSVQFVFLLWHCVCFYFFPSYLQVWQWKIRRGPFNIRPC